LCNADARAKYEEKNGPSFSSVVENHFQLQKSAAFATGAFFY